VGLPSCPGFPSLGLLGAQLSGKAQRMGLSLPHQHTPLGQTGNGCWGYLDHEIATVTLSAAGWSTGSVPTAAAAPFPSLPHIHPTGCVGSTGGRIKLQPKGKACPAQDVLSLRPRMSSCSWSVGPLPLPVRTHLCKMHRPKGVGGMSGAAQ